MFTRSDDKISTSQTSIFITNTLLGAGLLTLPRSVTEAVQTPDAWISVLLGGVSIILVALVMVKLSQQFPNNTVFQYSKRIIGTIPAAFLCLLLITYFIIVAGFEARIMAEVTQFYLLEGTPIWAVIIAFIWVGSYLIFGGINSIARVYQIIFPIAFLTLFLSYFLSFRLFDIDYLRPVLSEGMLPVIKGMKSTVLVFSGFEVTMNLVAHMRNPERAVKAVITGISIPIVIYLMTVIVVIGGMSTDAVLRSTWPTLDLLRSFEVAGLFFERFEFPFLVIWLMQMFCTFLSFYFNASLGISQVFNIKVTVVFFGLIPLIFLSSIIPKRINDVFKVGNAAGLVGLLLVVFIIGTLFVINIIRRKGLKQDV